jgi:hypothetical protein
LPSNEATDVIFALVLNYAAKQKALMKVSEAWLSSFDDNAISALLSTKDNYVVNENREPVEAT